MTPTPKRRWLRFSLRTLFVVMTVFACWLGYYMNWKNQRQEAGVWLRTQVVGGNIIFDPKPASAFPWMLKLLGEEPRELILMRYQPTDQFQDPIPDDYRALVHRVERLFPEAVVMDTTRKPPANRDK